MNKPFLSFLTFCLFFSEANAGTGTRCQCNYEPTGWSGSIRVFTNTGGTYTPCLKSSMTTCDNWGKQTAQASYSQGAIGLPTPPDLQCIQFGSCRTD
ncbi:MAG: hypothetical protein ACD_16C00246G0001 [uncultured bacterium]|nr:MAG: hypothetical protein ACD_16C00246G0001 [uncultured bacterium]